MCNPTVQFSQNHHFTCPRKICAAIARSKLGRILFFLAPLLILAACQPTPDLTEISGAIQGTTYHIKMVLPEPHEDLPALRGDIDQTFKDIDLKLSNYRDDSEITRFNRRENLEWVPVSPELTYLTHLAEQVSAKTGGCFDLTIKPLFDLWGFSNTVNRIPSDAEIKQVLTHVVMNK